MKEVYSNMAGTVMQILVSVGDEVSAGNDIAMLESMKMEVPITSESSGKVVEVKAGAGDFVNEGDVLIVLE